MWMLYSNLNIREFDIRELIPEFEYVVFQFIPQSSNFMADDLAKKTFLTFEDGVPNFDLWMKFHIVTKKIQKHQLLTDRVEIKFMYT